MTDLAREDFADWIGRFSEVADVTVAAPVRRLAATLGHDGAHWPAGMLPPLGHWLFHLPDAPRDALGADGHPAKGGFLPPIAFPRRMWAGGRLRFLAPVPIGTTLRKRSTITAIADKGAMTFVTLRHELIAAGILAIEEEQDLVYLPIAPPGPARPVDRPPPRRAWEMVADEVMLFRFSALTFNAHRIHYDLPYAQAIERYPALVVHGPLQAMLLIDAAQREGFAPASFAFRARAPLYAGRRFSLAAAAQDHWIVDEQGTVTMTAEIGAA